MLINVIFKSSVVFVWKLQKLYFNKINFVCENNKYMIWPFIYDIFSVNKFKDLFKVMFVNT